MTSNSIFRGVGNIALITPLNESGIDFSAFARLIDWQIAEGVAALVIAGTTGEGSTLTDGGTPRRSAICGGAYRRPRARDCRHRLKRYSICG